MEFEEEGSDGFKDSVRVFHPTFTRKSKEARSHKEVVERRL